MFHFQLIYSFYIVQHPLSHYSPLHCCVISSVHLSSLFFIFYSNSLSLSSYPFSILFFPSTPRLSPCLFNNSLPLSVFALMHLEVKPYQNTIKSFVLSVEIFFWLLYTTLIFQTYKTVFQKTSSQSDYFREKDCPPRDITISFFTSVIRISASFSTHHFVICNPSVSRFICPSLRRLHNAYRELLPPNLPTHPLSVQVKNRHHF